MPEFHLRRKQRKNRRHTIHDSSNQRQQLQRALEMYDDHHEIILGPNEISVDDAVAGRRISSTDGSVIKKTNSSSEPTIKANIVRKISSKYSECLYLRYNSEMRRCPMPSPINITTIKQLFVNMFDLIPSTISDPSWHLFILDRSNSWKPLEFVSVVYDHCTILLVDSNDIGTLIPSPISVTHDTRTSRCSTATPDNDLLELSPSPNDMRSLSMSPDHYVRPKSFDISLLPSIYNNDHSLPLSRSIDIRRHSIATSLSQSSIGIKVLSVYESVQKLKHDLTISKQQHAMEMNEINLQFQMTKQTLLAALKGTTAVSHYNEQSSFRQERIALDNVKQVYSVTSNKAYHDLSLLQAVIEELRIDAVNRRCKIDSEEIHALMGELAEHQTMFHSLQSQYVPFEEKLKDIMKKELTVIVNEESYIQEESTRLEEGMDICAQLSKTLLTLKQFSTLQSQRSPHVPVFSTVPEVNREALLMSIISITPNHIQRLETITLAEQVQQKRKLELSPSRRALKEFEKSLKTQQQNLKATNNLEIIEKQLEEKAKLLYNDERIKRQQELEKELQIKEEMKKKKKQKEMELIKAKFKIEEDRLIQEEERQKEELRKVREEKEKLEIERKRNEEERKKLEKLKKQQQEEDQKRIKRQEDSDQKRIKRQEQEDQRRIKRQEEEDQRRIKRQEQEEQQKKEMERMKKMEEDIRQTLEKEKQEERKKLDKLRLQQVEELLRKEIEKEKQEERRKFEEEQRLFDELLNNDSPDTKAKRKDILWKQIQERARQEIEEEQRIKEKTNQLRSQQMIMDNNYKSSMAGSTPLITRRNDSPSKGNDYCNHFNSHRSNPYLPQDNGFNSEYCFQHIDLTSSYPSAPIHRRLVPSLSTDLKQEPSYDSLEKIFKSEENVTNNHYDLPWNSKKLPFGSNSNHVQRRGTIGSCSPVNHRRNKSEGVSDMIQQESFQKRENLTPSPGYHYTPSPLTNSPMNTSRSPVYDDVNHRIYKSDQLPKYPRNQSVNGQQYDPNNNGTNLPLYSQIIKTNSPATNHRQRSMTTNAKLTHHPLTNNPQKPSVSYV